jgi:hypothetical protein
LLKPPILKNTVMRNAILISWTKILDPVFVSVLFVATNATAQPIPTNFYKPKINFIVGTIPFSVALGDIDGDGKPEMVVANSNSNTISVFRNTSTTGSINASSFATKVDFPTGNSPTVVVIADLDGDGKPELIVPNRSSNNISILRNTSTLGSINASSFAAKIDFATGTEPISSVIGDVDGDGKSDLVVNNYNSNTISVLRNTSTPGSINASSFAAKIDFATSVAPSIVAIGDVDGDGRPEVAVSNFLSNTISVFRNTSTSGVINASSFAPKVDFATGDNPYFVVINDIDGDSKPELVVTNVSSVSVSLFRNTSSTGSINASSFAAKVDFTVGFHPVTVAIGDVDGDSKPDLVVANQLSDNISVLRNTVTSGSINASSFAAKTDFPTDNQPVSVAIGDIDGDGIPEIAATNYNSNTVSIFQKDVCLDDNIKPIITYCPTIPLQCYSADNNYTIPVLNATDNCGVQAINYIITGVTSRNGSGNNASGIFNLGTSTITWTVTDAKGNTATCNTTVVVDKVDVTIPDVKVLTYNSIALNTVYPPYGPASSITLVAQPSGDSGSDSYSWSNGASTPSIAVSPTSNTTYAITVTDAGGCQATTSKEVIVRDINCNNGKVYMCHITGNSSHVNTICIDNNAVATHLAAGCSLGECIGSRNAPSVIESEAKDFSIQILPNPSKNYFTLSIKTNDVPPISVRVMDILGRVIVIRTNVIAGNLVFGHDLTAGVYMAEIVQGTNRKLIKLVKQ